MGNKLIPSHAARIAGIAAAAIASTANADYPQVGSRLWIGTYTTRGSEGIYSLSMDPGTGALGAPVLGAKIDNPSFLALHPNGKTLYAVSETSRFEGKPGGAVAAFAVEPDSGALRELTRQSSGGAAPCHLAVHPSGKCLVVANYSSGNVSAFPLGNDGGIGKMAGIVQHDGRGVNLKRQEAPHAHGVTFDPTGAFVFVADLGIDRIKAYKVDAAKATMTSVDSASAILPPGYGPRHFLFAKSGNSAYSVDELSVSVSHFSWNAALGELRGISSVSFKSDHPEGSTAAEIALHPNGKFLYASNRGHDSIAVFSLDADSGAPTLIQTFPSGGRSPRSIAIAPDGEFMVAANQESDNLVVMRIDSMTGKLFKTSHAVKIPAPVCVLFQ